MTVEDVVYLALKLARFSNGSFDYFMRLPLWQLRQVSRVAGRIDREESDR